MSDREFAVKWLDERCGAPTTSRAQMVADGLAVRLRDACDRHSDYCAEVDRQVLRLREKLIEVVVHGIAEEDRYGQAGAHEALTRKTLALEIWSLLNVGALPPNAVAIDMAIDAKREP